jgi:hypothetical protein
MRSRYTCVFVLAGLFGCAGFASSEGSHAPADRGAIAAIHARKCGSCHMAPQPKSHTREQLDLALGRHKSRVKLTTAQWAAMIDYLAAPDGSTAGQPR